MFMSSLMKYFIIDLCIHVGSGDKEVNYCPHEAHLSRKLLRSLQSVCIYTFHISQRKKE